MNMLRSIWAVVAGFITVVILSVGTDFVLESLGIFPPQSEPAAYTAGLLLVALVYRCTYTVAGGYVAARLAPDHSMRHAFILGFVGIVAGTIGVMVSWDLTPHHWYPVAVVVTALPCIWLGGKLQSQYSSHKQER